LKFPKNIYAWKIAKQEKPKAAKGWVDLFDWMKQEIQNHLTENNLEQKFVDFQHACDNNGDLLQERVRDGLKEKDFASDDSLILIGIKKFERMNGTQKMREDLTSLRELLDRFDLELNLDAKPSYDLKNWKEKVMKKYSMLNIINWYDLNVYRDDERKGNLKHLINYINVVDVCDASR
jgi:hypothetical protein